MIQSFANAETENLFYNERSQCFNRIAQVAMRKLIQLNQAETITDLAIPPGNRLKKLSGNLASHYSIRINEQWRIIFCWTDAGPTKVEIIDYH